MVIFEGWNAAGKGALIGKVIRNMEKVASEEVAAVASSWRQQKSPSPSAGPV